MICDGCQEEIIEGEHYMKLRVSFGTAGMGTPMPAGMADAVIVHHPACFLEYCNGDALIQDVFGR